MTNVTATEKQSTVASWGLQRLAMEDDLQLVADIWGGTKTMRQAGQRYLFQEPAETGLQYTLRLRMSTFFNAYKRTVKSLVGKPFSKPIIVDEKLDKKLADLINDVDNTGRHLDVFAVELLEQGIKDGLVFFLVEYPDMSGVANAAEEKAVAPRPYWVRIDARNVISINYSVANGQYNLLQVRIKESDTIAVGIWAERSIDQIRVLTPGAWEVWRQNKDFPGSTATGEEGEKWSLFDKGKSSITDTVPLIALNTNRVDYMQAEPPLRDLADKNIEHWQSSSDQRRILHVARVPILFGTGLSDDPTGEGKVQVISASAMVQGPIGADLKYVEHGGKAIEAGKDDIQSIENQMAVQGSQVLVKHQPSPAAKTATQTAADQEAEYCDLAVMVRLLEDALEQGIRMNGRFMDVTAPEDRFITINKEFGISARDAADAQLLLTARSAGELTQETFLNELKRRGILDPAVDVGDELEKLKLEAPTAISVGGAVGALKLDGTPVGEDTPPSTTGSTGKRAESAAQGAQQGQQGGNNGQGQGK